jgi:TolA-binding protein
LIAACFKETAAERNDLSWFKNTPIKMRDHSKTFFFFVLFLSFGRSESGPSGIPLKSAETADVRYYFRLQNEEFMRMMVPKEKYLLGLVKNILEEIKDRKSEGKNVSALGIDVMVTPKQTFLDAYVLELEKVFGLFEAISKLETKARKKADLSALEILSGLRGELREFLENQPLFKPDSAHTRTSEPDTADQSNETMTPSQTASGSKNPISAQFAEDLLDQWKTNQILDYKLKQTRFELIRAKLLNSATPREDQRMLQRDLRAALQTYSMGDYTLSRLQFRDILSAYSRYPVMDDILFYTAESSFGLNYLDEALETYQKLISRYPQSPFCGKALIKKIFIHYTYGQTDSMSAAYEKLTPFRGFLDEETFGVVAYLVGFARFNTQRYSDALAVFQQVPLQSDYYYPARYLSAACYSNVGSDEKALEIYYQLIEKAEGKNRNPILSQLRNNALLKLGLIYYERGENRRAFGLLNRVDKAYQYNDLTLLGKAWSAYRAGKPVEALQNAESLIQHSLFSNYLYEAKTLAARSKELLGQSDAAMKEMEQISSTGNTALRSRPPVLSDIQAKAPPSNGADEEANQARNLELFSEANQILRFLGDFARPVRTADTLTAEAGIQDKFNILGRKITVLDSLERRALGNRSISSLRNIRELRGVLIQTLHDQSRETSLESLRSVEDPVIRRMGLTTYLRYLFGYLLNDTIREKKRTHDDIAEIERMAIHSPIADKTGFQIRLEIHSDELDDYRMKLNQYEIWLRENMPLEFYVEIGRWASFSEYGISNIIFSRIRDIDSKMSEISRIVRQLEVVYQAKKIELGKRIESLLEDVAQIENQMRVEMQKKDEQEKERFFKNDYFEKTQRETPLGGLETEPLPQKDAAP